MRDEGLIKFDIDGGPWLIAWSLKAMFQRYRTPAII